MYRCRGCRSFLCSECVEEGHRLLFCRRCREQALPLDPEAPATSPAVERERRLGAPYSLRDALRYPFRGTGHLTLPVLAAYLVAADLLGGVPSIGMRLALLVLLPGMLFEIVRTTSEGDRVLPEWPDLTEGTARLGEVARGVGIAAIAIGPPWLVRRAMSCDLEPFLRTASQGACLAAAYAALAAGLLIALLAFGAAGTHASGWLVLRVDLHLEALFGPAGKDALGAALLVAALISAARLASAALEFVPVLGMIAAAAIFAYALFVSAHLVGRLFLVHRKDLDTVYRDPV